MTVEELLRTPLMKDAQLIAGQSGLMKNVTWCVPDTALQFDNWIMPGLLLLYTGKVNDKNFRGYIIRVLEDHPSGVLLFGGKSFTFVDEEDLLFCSEQELPVIRMPNATNPLSFSKRFASVVAKNFDEEQRTEEWLRALCYSGVAVSGETAGSILGYRSDYRYCCLLLKSRNEGAKTPLQVEIDTGFASDFLCKELSTGDVKPLHFIDEGLIVCFVPIPPGHTIKSVNEKIRLAVIRMKAMASSNKWSASVGTIAKTLAAFHDSFCNAEKTAEVVEALNVHEKVSFYDDWYMHMLLLKEPKAELKEHMEHTLSPILDNPELVDTLANYLTFGENLKITSTKMFIHVNTLKYRISRISELLNCDLRDPNVRFRLRMAITIERYLR